eukprot:gnl/TRDRNA2_/TRDRNA2_93594_c1_seq1.p1 gnl/TRDRNA2_/TRDRNA2_93594_c1~~gnl/TRDRNA2_/TRDRNA2_93594_c1_seq1.p1  ORF type:complete len:301 (-),score=63.29 gnl/TRDRNA2_/TRDRNA2_93594_c1_seq1:210-1040(-)
MDVAMVKSKMKDILARSIDQNQDGLISKAEFVQIVQIPEAMMALKGVGVEPFGLVDHADFIFQAGEHGEERGVIGFEEFMEVIMQLRQKNTATVKDVTDLRKFIHTQLLALEKKVSTSTGRRLSATLGAMSQTTSAGPDLSQSPTVSASMPSYFQNSMPNFAQDERGASQMAGMSLRMDKLEESVAKIVNTQQQQHMLLERQGHLLERLLPVLHNRFAVQQGGSGQLPGGQGSDPKRMTVQASKNPSVRINGGFEHDGCLVFVPGCTEVVNGAGKQ